jgi:hypothetical protein
MHRDFYAIFGLICWVSFFLLYVFIVLPCLSLLELTAGPLQQPRRVGAALRAKLPRPPDNVIPWPGPLGPGPLAHLSSRTMRNANGESTPPART